MFLKEKFNYIKVVFKIKLNKYIQSKHLRFKTGGAKYACIEKFSDFVFVDLFEDIKIVVGTSWISNKEEIFQIVKYLTKQNKKIEWREANKLFDIKDIIRISKINPNVILNFRYMEGRNTCGANENLTCKISSYIEIMKKIKYLKKVCETKYSNEDDKAIFVAVQITKYMRYDDSKFFDSCLENALIHKIGVCIDFSIAYFKILTEFGIRCKVITGLSGSRNYSVVDIMDHAWNQVRLNNKWYNIDLTWYSTGKTIEYFLVDDVKFKKNNRHQYESSIPLEKCNENYDINLLNEKIKRMQQDPGYRTEFDIYGDRL